MAAESAGASIAGPAIGISGPPRHWKAESLVALVGALGISAGILVLAYEEYWITFEVQAYFSYLTAEYQLECVGYGLLGVGVLLIGASWTMARSHRPRASATQGVFVRYRRNWGVGIGTLGYVLAAIGLLVVVAIYAGLLAGVTFIVGPMYYPAGALVVAIGSAVTGIGIAVWAIGAFLDRVSST
jgi:hypothetical protein